MFLGIHIDTMAIVYAILLVRGCNTLGYTYQRVEAKLPQPKVTLRALAGLVDPDVQVVYHAAEFAAIN
jgi:hypothetical protein